MVTKWSSAGHQVVTGHVLVVEDDTGKLKQKTKILEKLTPSLNGRPLKVTTIFANLPFSGAECQ